MNARRRAAFAAVLAIATVPSCSALSPGFHSDDPDVRLEALLAEWHSERRAGSSCVSGGWRYPYVDCGRIQAAIERLALDFPTHPGVLMANAVISYETDRPEKSIDYLDALLERGGAPPDAAVLRSRLAIEQGNLQHAHRLLERHAQLEPAHAGIREAMASVHYLQGEYESARRDLRVAERLGAPAWRTAYNRGLIEEAEGNDQAAIDLYREALRGKPDWAEPRSRLRGIESRQGL